MDPDWKQRDETGQNVHLPVKHEFDQDLEHDYFFPQHLFFTVLSCMSALNKAAGGSRLTTQA